MNPGRFPTVSITISHRYNCGADPAVDYVSIEFSGDKGSSAGFINLGDTSEILLLKSAIDSFIKEHNIKPQETHSL